jgi:hypothetical protein
MNAVQIRQGDILLVHVATLPVGLERKPTKNGKVTVGYGEVTGHTHTIQDAVWLVAPETTMDDLHQVLRQRQYEPGRILSVRD